MTGCATCGVTDELLFTCEHCDRQFCSAHELPHHACTGFTRASTDAAEADGWQFDTAGEATAATVEAPEPPTEAAATPDGSATPDEATADDATADAPPTATAGESPESVPFAASDRDAAKGQRPDRERHWIRPPGKGLPHERGGEHPVFAWMREQSYPAYIAKVGGLSLLLTCSYYLGFVAVTYGLPF